VLEKLTVYQPSKKFTAFYTNEILITLFTGDTHSTLSWTK